MKKDISAIQFTTYYATYLPSSICTIADLYLELKEYKVNLKTNHSHSRYACPSLGKTYISLRSVTQMIAIFSKDTINQAAKVSVLKYFNNILQYLPWKVNQYAHLNWSNTIQGSI